MRVRNVFYEEFEIFMLSTLWKEMLKQIRRCVQLILTETGGFCIKRPPQLEEYACMCATITLVRAYVRRFACFKNKISSDKE